MLFGSRRLESGDLCLYFVPVLGIYKPRLKCYDLNNLGIKFERCLDAEVVAFEILSDDYSKVEQAAYCIHRVGRALGTCAFNYYAPLMKGKIISL